jgi:hypothetical protein
LLQSQGGDMNETKETDMTEQQFEAAMRTFNLELEYRDYIMEKASLENGDGIFRLMNSGDYYEGFKEKMVTQRLETKLKVNA